MKLAVAQGAKRVLEAVHTHKSDRGELVPVDPRELEGYRETAVGQAFGIESAMVSGDGRVMRIMLGAFRPQVTTPEPGHETMAEIHGDSAPVAVAARELSDAEIMAEILAEPNYHARSTMLVLEHGRLNARRR